MLIHVIGIWIVPAYAERSPLVCGLVGIYHRDGKPVDVRLLASMNDTLVHRGPDAEGLWVQESIGLAHRRLAIRDCSTLGNQPMSDIQGHVHSVFNGEIYNDGELRRELEQKHGFNFRSACDAEIIPVGYLAWGSGLFERLEGMFAIALWDARARQLVVARDGVGIKPLFICQDAQTVRFASEVKALLADRAVDRKIQPESLATFLVQGYVSPNETLLASVEFSCRLSGLGKWTV